MYSKDDDFMVYRKPTRGSCYCCCQYRFSLPFHAYKVTYSRISSVYSRIMFALRNHLLFQKLCPHISRIPMCFALVVYQTKPLVFFLQTTQCHHLPKTCISIGIYKRVKKFTTGILLLPGTAADLTIQFTVLLLHNISPIPPSQADWTAKRPTYCLISNTVGLISWLTYSASGVM